MKMCKDEIIKTLEEHEDYKKHIDVDLHKMYHYGGLVDHPKHYNRGDIEVIDVMLDWNLSVCLTQVLKYLGRCEHKGNKLQDLQKMKWYIEKEIKLTE